MRRKRGRLAVVALTLVLPIATPSPAAASVSGSVTFHCTAKLQAWPTFGGSGVCENGPSPAAGYVNLGGTDNWGSTYAVQGLGRLHAEFNYQEGCIANEPPLLGTAEGVATVEDVPAVDRGVVTTADVHARFVWTRVGANAQIQITSWTIDFAHGGTAVGSIGAGHATFAPILQPHHFCPAGGPLQALVQGEVTAAV